jgi:hypothetical protein
MSASFPRKQIALHQIVPGKQDQSGSACPAAPLLNEKDIALTKQFLDDLKCLAS